ncbi:MAG: amidohydrolase family protein [Rhizobiales bacterium]|nr:amidohydrolase family protein [Hyphomicrobiales bacterium]
MNETPEVGTATEGPKVLINARLIDPASGRDEPGGLLIRDGRIADLGAHLRRNAPAGAEVVDCNDNIVMPGLVDMLVYTGEPGEEHRETLNTVSLAASAGGVTTIACLPNTDRHLDDVALVDFILRRARDTARVNVLPIAALTKGMMGEEMAEIGLLRAAGAVAFSDGPRSLGNARLMARLLAYTRDFDGLVVHHVEDPDLAADGVMHEGQVATLLGLPGIPTVAELVLLERDLRLVESVGGRYHAAQISSAQSLEAIRTARQRGVRLTCGVSINHLLLDDRDIGSYRTYFKLSPPLRGAADRDALVAGVASGDIDVIVSAHLPQDVDGKRRPFAEAATGAIGVETLLPAALRLADERKIDRLAVLRALTCNPADLLGIEAGRLAVGAPADVVVVDPEVAWVVELERLHSRSKNSPFEAAPLKGRVMRTFVAGRQVHPYPAQDRPSQ